MPRRVRAAVLSAVLLALLAASWLWGRARRGEGLRRVAAVAADQAAARITRDLSGLLAAVDRLGRSWGRGEVTSPLALAVRVAELRRQHPELLGVHWADDNGVVRWVAPPTPRLQGLDLRQPGGERAAFRRARGTRRLQLSGPLQLVQGGRGLAAILPLSSRGEQRGYLYAVLVLEPLMRGSLSGLSGPFSIRVSDGAGALYQAGAEPDATRASVRQVSLAGRTWRLTLAPAPTLAGALSPPAAQLPALLALLLIGGLAFVVQRGSPRPASEPAGPAPATPQEAAAADAGAAGWGPLGGETFRRLADATGAMILMVKEQLGGARRIVFANRAAARITGFDPQKLAQMDALDLLTPDSRQRLRQLPDISDPAARIEVQCQTANGPFRWLERSATVVELPDEGLVELSTNYDITDRKEAELALRRSEARYRTIFQTTGTATIIYDTDGVITLANAVFANLVSRPLAEIEGRLRWSDLFLDGDDRVDPSSSLRRVRTWDSVVPESHEVRLRDRFDRVHEGIVTVNLIPGTSERVASFLDLTERKQVEQQMYRAERMAALGQIIAGVAHEINNPNNFIYLNLPILRRYMEALRPLLEPCLERDPELTLLNMPFEDFWEDLARLLDNMQHGSSRISEIVSELRQHVRSDDSGELEPGDLRSVVDRVMALVGKQVRKQVQRLELSLAPELPTVVINPGRIEQVLINLLINAGQAADKEDSWIRLSAGPDPEGGGVLIEVQDNGCGMPPDVLDKIFDPFFTTKGREVGTGLGLSICQRIVEEHGGQISVHSEPGQGSRFCVRLPAAEEGDR
jgi:PAS domain S-box-containing protein